MKTGKQKRILESRTRRAARHPRLRAFLGRTGKLRRVVPLRLLSVLSACVIFGMFFVPQLLIPHAVVIANTSSMALPSGAASETSGLLRLQDPKDGTSLIIQIDNNPDFGIFTFVAPFLTSSLTQQYHGGNANDLHLHGRGQYSLDFPGSVLLIEPDREHPGSSTTMQADVHIFGTIDAEHFQANVTLFNQKDTQRFSLVAKGPGSPLDAVNVYNHLILQPEGKEPDFLTMFADTSRSVTGGYSKEDFASLLQQQEQRVGKITSIVVISTSTPITDPAGITYFQITEQVKRGGRKDTEVSVFVLEDDTWKFWFTCLPIG